MSTLVPQKQDRTIQLYTDDLREFCQFVVEFTEVSKHPEWTATVCEEQAETVRIKLQDLTTDTIDLLLETLLTVIDTLEGKRMQEQQHKQWIWRVKKRFADRTKRKRSAKQKRRLQKVVVMQVTEPRSLPPADLVILEPMMQLQDYDLN